MRVSMQENIDVIRRMSWRKVLQTEFQSASHNIGNQRPLEITVAVSAYNNHGRSDRPQLIENRFRANIAEMPDFISVLGRLCHALRQPIVRVGKNEDPQYRCPFLLHFYQRKFGRAAYKNKAATLLKRDGLIENSDFLVSAA